MGDEQFTEAQAAYHKHLDTCRRCSETPMSNACEVGQKLLREAALRGAAGMLGQVIP